MKMTWKAIITTGILSIACITTVAVSQEQGGFFRQRAKGMIIREIEHELQITDVQRTEIKNILATEKPAIQALAQQIQQQNEQLAAQQTFNEAYIRNFAQQHASTTADALVEREKVRFEILQVLTPDQRQKLMQVRQVHRNQLIDRLASLGEQL